MLGYGAIYLLGVYYTGVICQLRAGGGLMGIALLGG
jgi:hypothetical protein